MTVTLELKPETVARLNEEAGRRGVQPDELALELIEVSFPKRPEELSDVEFESLLDQLAEGGENLPVLPRDLIDSRAFYYEGRD